MAIENLQELSAPIATNGQVTSVKAKAAAKSAKKVTGTNTIANDPPVVNGNHSDEPVAQPKTKKQAAPKKAKPVVESQPKAAETAVAKTKKAPAKKAVATKNAIRVTFKLRFHTTYGQSLFISGNHELLGNNDPEKALPMQYLDHEHWVGVLELAGDHVADTDITYNYILRNNDGSLSYDWGNDKVFNPAKLKKETLLADGWNFAGYYENAFYTEPFHNVLLRANHTPVTVSKPKKVTHTFKVKAPLLSKGQTLCIVGSDGLGNWDTVNPILLSRNIDEVHYTVGVDLSNATGGVFYKYGIYDVAQQAFVRYEGGQNRVLTDLGSKDVQVIVNDAFAVFETTTWKGAGIAIPVFSLRSQQSFGVGEFTDIALLVDWAKNTGMKLIQLLPVNDTTATHSWHDSYPYAAISAFALHPLYVNVLQMADKANKVLVQEYEAQRTELNGQEFLDYQPVMELKLEIARKLYDLQKKKTFATKDYKQYFEQNKHWLVPYAVFCHLRDTYGTADFNAWPAHTQYKAEEIAALMAVGSADYNSIAFHYFVQYHLHLQLRAAKQYAHQHGVIIKGDIAIGIYRYGVDAWQQPELYNMHLQAGAPPDDFAVKGQNWGFPTYNWQRMKEDGFAWWKQRFEQMSDYFDAFRIDHILGFFRIWSIPMHAVEGIMGHFVPAIPVHRNEFDEKGIWFDYHRFTKPFINDAILWEVFGYEADFVKEHFLTYDGFGNYTLKPEFATQRLVEKHFATWEANDFNERIKIGLYDLISNVILFAVEGSQGQQFHFRFAITSTTSYKHLDGHLQQQLSDLYVDYFFRRQDDFWKKEAMQKLPALKRVTNMLVCGEDLGLVPDCVPGVMKQLGLLSLEIQRMPKDPTRTFFHPADAPYLSVVTPSTHDMSIIRGWWEEDRTRTQDFYNNQLGQWGQAPYFCEPWINKLIVDQHLYSPAMWSIFQLQDLLGMDGNLRRENPEDERINVPANPKHYWKYRMNLKLEELLQQTGFNQSLHNSIVASGRN